MPSHMIPRRRNGFTPPYSKAQISAWVALMLTCVQFPIFVSPIMPIEASIPVTIFFFGLVFGTIYHGILALAIDPMDPHLGKHLKENHAGEPSEAQEKESASHQRLYAACNPLRDSDNNVPLPIEAMKQCWICDTQVADHSMHCKFCNKCVYHFDHHCMWLNTCIGQANYQSFFRTMIYIFGMELAHFIIQIALIIDIFIGGPTKDRAGDWFNAGTNEVVIAVLIVFLVFNSVSVFLIGQLLWFHSGLQRENLTTYKYIVRDHQRKRDKMRLEGEIMQLRHTEMAKAQQQGKKFTVFRLEMGDRCRQFGFSSCDPLNVPKVNTSDADPENGFGAALGPSLSQETGVKSSMEILPPPIESKVQENGNGASGGGVSFIKVNNQDEQKEPDVAPAEPKIQENGHGDAPAEPKIQENGHGVPSTDPVVETKDQEAAPKPDEPANGNESPTEVEAPVSDDTKD